MTNAALSLKESHRDRTLSIVKAECTRVVYEEVDKTIDDDVVQPCGGVMQVTFHNNMLMGLNLSFITWAASGKVEKESLSIFSNESMASGYISESSTY